MEAFILVIVGNLMGVFGVGAVRNVYGMSEVGRKGYVRQKRNVIEFSSF